MLSPMLCNRRKRDGWAKIMVPTRNNFSYHKINVSSLHPKTYEGNVGWILSNVCIDDKVLGGREMMKN